MLGVGVAGGVRPVDVAEEDGVAVAVEEAAAEGVGAHDCEEAAGGARQRGVDVFCE